MSAAGAHESTSNIFLIAGEPSGDALGAALMAALKERTGGRIRFSGIGGSEMSAQGMTSLFPMSELAVMGLAEVVPRIPRLLRRIRQTVDTIAEIEPDAVVTIDAPGFCFRVAARLKKIARHGRPRIPIVHYVAPQVWAWRKGRARKLPRYVDHLLCLLPFEPPYFEVHGLECTFVGHPAAGPARGGGKSFRARYKIPDDATVLCLLPGSRRDEVTRLLPVFRETVARLAKQFPGLVVAAATAAPMAGLVAAGVAGWPVPVIVTQGEERFGAMAGSDVALAASGTVTLELAREGTPTVVAYRMNPVTGWLARLLVRLKYVTLINIILGREAIPERLLGDCTPEALAAALTHLIRDAGARSAQQAAMAEGLRRLAGPGRSPGMRAADAVLRVIGRHGTEPAAGWNRTL